jgi:hypothetical protein
MDYELYYDDANGHILVFDIWGKFVPAVQGSYDYAPEGAYHEDVRCKLLTVDGVAPTEDQRAKYEDWAIRHYSDQFAEALTEKECNDRIRFL